MRIFVVDGNWYLWRAAHVYKSILPMAEGLPYDVLAMVMKDALQLKAHATLVAFDGARLFRNKLYPEYKANRREGRLNDGQHDAENGPVRGDLRDQVYGALPGIYQLFDEVGLAYYQPPKYEADDVLCSVAHTFGNEHTVICGTKDKDAYQYLRPSVRLYDSSAKGKDGKSKPRFITEEDCVKKFGVLPRQMIAYQTLLGDPGDNIMPLPNMKPARVKKLLNEYGSVTKWMAKDKEAKTYLTVHQEHLRLNRKLVTLVTEALPPASPDQWKLRRTKSKNKWLTRNYHDYHLFLYPKTKGLFG